ncbi:MAG: hypothetical protein HGB12_03300 [Bacteroidetes bacterium]|nr:hypothetical protein [Bacteroidota bacterium]
MDTAELKSNLHKLIVETDDISVLSKIQAYISTLKSKKIDWWDDISNMEKKAIESGLKQLDNGEGVSDEVVNKKVNKLLRK